MLPPAGAFLLVEKDMDGVQLKAELLPVHDEQAARTAAPPLHAAP